MGGFSRLQEIEIVCQGIVNAQIKGAFGESGVLGLPPSVAALDAFGRQRVATPFTLFDGKQLDPDFADLFFDEAEVSGSGTSGANIPAGRTMSVSNVSAGRRVRQSFDYFNYEPGKSQFIALTGIIGSAKTGIITRLGYFDDNNGIFFEVTQAGLFIVRRSNVSGSPVDIRVAQTDFNIDTFDGNGLSGVTFNPDNTAIFWIDLEWLGVGDARIGFYHNGLPYVAHIFKNTNTLDEVYIATPNLPIRYEISNDGAGGVATITTICSTVISEGGQDGQGVTRGIGRGDTVFSTASNTNINPLLSLRLQSGKQGAQLAFLDASIVPTSNLDAEIMLILNPTIGGSDAAVWAAISNSGFEFDIARDNTNVLSNGTVLFSQVIASTNQFSGIRLSGENIRRLGIAIDGTRDEVVLAIRPLISSNSDYYASLNFRELL